MAVVHRGNPYLELSSASFAYPQHDGAVRARFAKRLMSGASLEWGFTLATCLRVEIVVPGGEHDLERALESLFGDIAAVTKPQVRHGERAAAHLFRIAAGLESPILGEYEILTQFRQALIEAEEAGRVEGLFARFLEAAVGVGRQARELLPGSPHNSMAAVAAQSVGTAEQVAVLGSGVMATAVVEALCQLPAPPGVTVVARNPEKVQETPGVEVLAFHEATDVLENFPAVISATSAKHGLIEDEALAEAVARRDRPLVLIDMAMPPDFNRPTSGQVTYVDIDDLARMADRRSRSEKADALVDAASAEAFRKYRDHHEIGPVIGGLMTHADEIVDEIVERFAGRLDSGDEAVLRQAVHTVARTLLAGPVSYLKQEDRSPEAVDVIADAFGVDE